jgi:Protein of unknown function (DUF3485)
MTTTLTEVKVLPRLGGKSNNSADNVTQSPWKWCAIACALLSISAGVRFSRDWQFATVTRESEICPFPLRELPTSLGTWNVIEGTDSQLDPEIAKIAGSSDHIIRSYHDSKTGETATIMLLYGLATKVCGHIPEVCYPAAGYQPLALPVDRTISVSGSETPVGYRSLYFSKTVAGSSSYTEVFCTLMHNGTWLPDVANRWKMFRQHPGMFKLQIQCDTTAITTEHSPAETLVKEIVGYINNRIDKRNAAPAIGLPPEHTPAK